MTKLQTTITLKQERTNARQSARGEVHCIIIVVSFNSMSDYADGFITDWSGCVICPLMRRWWMAGLLAAFLLTPARWHAAQLIAASLRLALTTSPCPDEAGIPVSCKRLLPHFIA